MATAYKESYMHYTTPSGNTQIFVYRRKPRRGLIRKEKYLIKQKLLGLALVVIGIIGCFLVANDCGGFVFATLIAGARVITN